MNLSQFKKNGKFLMLALDHRGSFKKVINPQNPDSVTNEEMIKNKAAIIQTVGDQATGILVDVNWGLPALKSFGYAQVKPYLLAIEKTGYQEKNGGRVTEPEYSVEQLSQMGAKGIKLLIYFNPFSSTAVRQLQTARDVYSDCQMHDLPFFLEIVTYHTDLSVEKNNNLIIESIKRFLSESIRADVFKIEFPGDENSCQQTTNLLKSIPWILLTRGENFEIFKHQLQVAIRYGCQGFLAGRALWQKLGQYSGAEKEKFLNTTVKERFKEISKIALNI